MPRVPAPRCFRCGEPRSWPVTADVAADDAGLSGATWIGCAGCAEWPVALRSATAPFAFDGTASRLVKALKYGRWRALAEPMGRSMRSASVTLLERSEGTPLLIPVPLTPARQRERGFNQAAALAEVLGRHLDWRCANMLERRPGGRRQARLARRARSENVRDAFHVSGSVSRGVSVILVDDVLTTGATAVACAATLHEAGFGRVSVVTFARTLRPPEITDHEG